MRLACVIAALCACQGEPAPAMAPAPAPAPATAAVVARQADGVRLPDTAPAAAPKRLAHATHGRAIVGVALSDDGAAAVTIDSGNGVRLWPALDGSREPVAVPLAAPVETVLARSGDMFHLAALDAAGGLTVVRVDAKGQLVDKAAMPFGPPYELVVAVGGDFLALRADQRIERIDATGRVLGAVAPAAGERVTTVAARSGRALAMIARADGVVARWLDPAGGLAWGASSPHLAIDPVAVALSPDHVRLAAVGREGRRGVIVELVTGDIARVRAQDVVPLGWLAADRVAFIHDEFELSRVAWFDVAGKRVASIGDDFELEFVSVLQMQAADDRIVSFLGHQLVLVEPRRLRYLGYQTHAASWLRATPAGMVVAVPGGRELLDTALQVEPGIRAAKDLLPLDETFTVAVSGRPTKAGPFDDALVKPQPRASGIELALYDGPTRVQTLRLKVSALHLRYEPATRLVAMPSGSSITFVRFDARTRRLGEPTEVAVGAKVRTIHLLDPALARGAVALAVLADGRARLVDGQLAVGEAFALPYDVEAVDRAGRSYARHDNDTIAIYDGDREVGQLTGLTQMQVSPAPDGARIARFGRGRIVVTTRDDKPVWSIGFPGVEDVQWTDDALVAVANGIAKLDPATGATVAARCGWKFALRSTASFLDLAGSTICDR